MKKQPYLVKLTSFKKGVYILQKLDNALERTKTCLK